MAEKGFISVENVEELLNDGVNFLKKFLQDETGNKLTTWAQSGFINQYTGFIQEQFNKIPIEKEESPPETEE